MDNLRDRVLRLKEERDAVILAHNYTLPAVQDLADYVGDSLGLALEAFNPDASVIVFCGVTFMGETAKILNPERTVLLPDPDAKCAMAAMCSGEQIREFKERNPGCAVVGYVNSTAEAKAEMDVCCTSSNAVKVVESLDEKDVLFVPDMNLGRYVASKTDKNITLWDGFCPIHHSITADQVRELRYKHPDAPVLAHPECRMEVLAMADQVGSTERILEISRAFDSEEFIILTEIGMMHRLMKFSPGKRFYFPDSAVCGAMKMTGVSSLIGSLESGLGEITIPDAIMERARVPLERMISVAR